jgi:hypothetical protein
MTYAHFQTSTKVQKHAQQSEPTLKLTKVVSQAFFSGSLKTPRHLDKSTAQVFY